jgi:L-ascorbate metabolism protein UlaG (beta-lactamase superfamily)
MKIRLIRNATLLLDYAGQHILIDPYFAARHSLPSYTGRSPNPLVMLPLPPEHILPAVALVIISHLHTDHFDAAAQALVPKDLPLFCQPGNEDVIRAKGFQRVTPIAATQYWQNLNITRIGGHHGRGEVEGLMGAVAGFVFQASSEPTLYWAGDTILCAEVEQAIDTFKPALVVTHSCGAMWPDRAGQRSLIVMDDAQTVAVCRRLADGRVIATHMEALDHATITRAQLRQTAQAAGIDERKLLIPADGATITAD